MVERVLGVISDTHIPTRAKKIPRKVLDQFSAVDLILHAGDVVTIDVIDELSELAPVEAVAGNMDYPDVRSKFPEFRVLEIEGRRIGIKHDTGSYLGLSESARWLAAENKLDVLVFGHTHRQLLEREEGRLYLNPGSPTNPIPPFFIRPSFAVLKIGEEGIEAEIITI
ncbi:MAG TPA: metallophosphoesterase [Candidatus Korarchaeota archaeon]|nr:MAG: YfcE family phosphodiesterase [Candidatus Korarchaeota archaeon]HDI73721.1 metallophosphoesterase [Candidatus Korarchaeota archaeon]